MGEPPPKINNYLVPSILATIFCCWPMGIAAIVFAAQANSKMGQGDYEGAVQSAEKAKTWTWITVGAGALIGVIYIALMILGAAAGN
ncbi:MAG: CD225/dispanin family protein [Candidatus Eremiobacteraeota bacterium]|nr:CD225/dispanin family protein [Candidatus Eremiobacteraeota bacterium]